MSRKNVLVDKENGRNYVVTLRFCALLFHHYCRKILGVLSTLGLNELCRRDQDRSKITHVFCTALPHTFATYFQNYLHVDIS